jgi:hypothetical protein
MGRGNGDRLNVLPDDAHVKWLAIGENDLGILFVEGPFESEEAANEYVEIDADRRGYHPHEYYVTTLDPPRYM